MLKTLAVWNFALLEQVHIGFGRGLNVLTGETGAGKSILIGALGAVLGCRLSAEDIRTGCDWLRVEGVFEPAASPELLAILREQAIPVDESALIVTRQLTRKGKGAALVNGCRVTLATLRRIGECLGDIHGQHENLALLKPACQFAWLDGSDAAIAPQRERYASIYERWHTAQRELDDRRQHARERAERRDMLSWQHKEIGEAALQPGEREQLESEVKRLSHAERITEHIAAACNVLDGGEDGEGGANILDALSELEQHLKQVAQYDESLSTLPATVAEVGRELREVFYTVRDYRDGLEFDPQALDAMQSRLDTIERLCRKYGAADVDEVLRHDAEIAAELAAMDDYDDSAAAANVAKLRAEMSAEAAKLSALRKRAAEKLSQQVGGQLRALGMPDGRLVVSVSGREPGIGGADDVELLFTANVGEPPKPLGKIASGGELSRLALAIKAVAANAGHAPDGASPSPDCMVFDEIDAGIGGQTALRVAERIALVARRKQVLCITHLPQIAAMADEHFALAKSSAGGKTTTAVERLDDAGRVETIARMASGDGSTEAALENAREMLAAATRAKTKGSDRP